MPDIDKNKLRELVADPKARTKDIAKALGFTNDATFYYALKIDAEAKEIFDSRRGARAKGPKDPGAKKVGKKSSKKSAAPPRNTNAKGANKELFKKLQHEFNHIDLYGATSEHFDELRDEINELT